MTYVVHLEDDETLQEILKVAFQATDPKVNLKQFISGDDAVGHIKPNVDMIDLFVLDIRVPGSIDGVGVARKIREFGSDAPIILTSAYRQPERELIDSLSLEWMSKPWHIMEISQRLISLAKTQRSKTVKSAAPSPTATPPAMSPVTAPPIPVVTTPLPAATSAPAAPPPPAATAPVAPAVPSTPLAATSTPTPAASPISPTIKPRLPSAPAAPPKPPAEE
jgi:hypothetical protein